MLAVLVFPVVVAAWSDSDPPKFFSFLPSFLSAAMEERKKDPRHAHPWSRRY